MTLPGCAELCPCGVNPSLLSSSSSSIADPALFLPAPPPRTDGGRTKELVWIDADRPPETLLDALRGAILVPAAAAALEAPPPAWKRPGATGDVGASPRLLFRSVLSRLGVPASLPRRFSAGEEMEFIKRKEGVELTRDMDAFAAPCFAVAAASSASAWAKTSRGGGPASSSTSGKWTANEVVEPGA